MMAQDMTRVILVLVLLGACLAVAVFRPQILPAIPSSSSPPSGYSPAPQEEAPPSPGSQVQRTPGQSEPTPLPEEPVGPQVHLEQWEKELAERQAQLEQWEKALAERQDQMEQWEKELAERQAQLEQREKALADREKVLNEQEAALQREKARLAAEREELGRLWRWLLAVAVVVGLMAVPSLVALYLLWRANRELSDAARLIQASRDGASRKIGPSSQPAAKAQALSGGNGRSRKEGVWPGRIVRQ